MVELDTKTSSGPQIENPPTGNHHVQCFVVIDLGIHSSQFGPKHKIKIGFETHKKIENGPEWAIGRPFGFYRTFNLSANERSSLMQFLDNWIPNLQAEIDKYRKPNGNLDITNMLIKRYGTGNVQMERWNDGEDHITLKTVLPPMDDHPAWDLVNGPYGTDDNWRYPRSVREARQQAITPPADFPNQYDEDPQGNQPQQEQQQQPPQQKGDTPTETEEPPF